MRRKNGRDGRDGRASCLAGIQIDSTMDYDKTTLPDHYDSGRFHGQDVLDLWMRTIAAHIPRDSVSRVLDLGCGTGRFSNALAEYFDAHVVGLDPSLKMLEQARAKP